MSYNQVGHARQRGGLFQRTVNTVGNLGAAATGRLLRAKLNQEIRNYTRPKARGRPKGSKKVVKKEDKSHLSEGHSGIITDDIRLKSTNPHMMKNRMHTGQWTYKQTYKYILTSLAGLQNVTNIVACNTIPQTILGAGPTYTYFQNEIALQQMNPYLTPTNANIWGTPSFTPLTDKFVIKRNTIDIELTNASVVAAILDIYIYCTKKLSNNGPEQVWNTGYAQQVQGTEPLYQQALAGGATLAAAGYENNGVVGAKPTDTKLFNQYFKTCAVRHVELASAASKILKIDIEVNRIVDTALMRNENSGGAVFHPSQTYVIQVVQRGSLVIDDTLGLTNQPTYGSTKVICVAMVKTEMQALKGNADRLATDVIFSNITAGAAATAQNLLNEIDVPTTTATGTAS